ncbi:MAG: imidazole glycerol phosphate synthase subunit HisH [Candidatus Baldrarchaeia archaeon]
MRIFIVNTGVGNIFSLKTAFKRLGHKTTISLSEEELRTSDAIVIPGVGNFESAVKRIEHIRVAIIDEVLSGKPLLGICLGYQLLFESSEEGRGKGLGIFRGRVMRLPNTVRVPHMGWNTIENLRPSPLVDGIRDESFVYFAHSYYPVPRENITIAETTYGVTFPSIGGREPVYGVQFHPERSGKVGLQILRNFCEVVHR